MLEIKYAYNIYTTIVGLTDLKKSWINILQTEHTFNKGNYGGILQITDSLCQLSAVFSIMNMKSSYFLLIDISETEIVATSLEYLHTVIHQFIVN